MAGMAIGREETLPFGAMLFNRLLQRIEPQQVIPCHYNTFPPIEADAQAFKSDVQNAGFSEVIVLDPGGTHRVK